MKLHTTAHLAYDIFTEKFGRQKVIGSNISERRARIDFIYPESISEKIPEIQNKVLNTIKEGLEVRTYEDNEKKDFRYWECVSSKMPCGGTHVNNTNEIGRVKIKRENLGKGKERMVIELAS